MQKVITRLTDEIIICNGESFVLDKETGKYEPTDDELKKTSLNSMVVIYLVNEERNKREMFFNKIDNLLKELNIPVIGHNF